jgi:hypothetical protein
MTVLRTLNVDEILGRKESGELKRRLRGRDLIGFASASSSAPGSSPSPAWKRRTTPGRR